MIKVGIVDDQRYDLEKLMAIVSPLEDFQIVFSLQDAEKAYEELKKTNVNLLITDIEMPGLSGYELADLIQSHAMEVDVIFVTGHSGYAVHAFELSVHDYIMKPYTRERLLKSIDRYRKKNVVKEEQGTLVIKQKSEIHFIRKSDIIFIERTGRSTTIVTTSGQFETYQPLNELETELSSRSPFVHIVLLSSIFDMLKTFLSFPRTLTALRLAIQRKKPI